jgi:hypothetical protein
MGKRNCPSSETLNRIAEFHEGQYTEQLMELTTVLAETINRGPKEGGRFFNGAIVESLLVVAWSLTRTLMAKDDNPISAQHLKISHDAIFEALRATHDPYEGVEPR